MVEEGNKAPNIALQTDDGKTTKLAQLKGRPVVLYFYPKDDTKGCTAEAQDFTELQQAFEDADAEVIGVSPDDMGSHKKFRSKFDLTVKLASDVDKSICEAFGVWVEKSMYGKKYMGVERSTFLIDRSGNVAKAWRKVKVPGHAEQVLAAVQALKN